MKQSSIDGVDVGIDGGYLGISSTEVLIDHILEHHKKWRQVVFEMFEQVSGTLWLGTDELRLYTFNVNLARLYRTLPANKKSIFKEGLMRLNSIIQTTSRDPADLNFDLRTMRLKRKDKFYEEMLHNISYGLPLV